MVTKEDCLLNQILNAADYGKNNGLRDIITKVFNYGKKYASDMIFVNDENGLDKGLEGYSPSFIVSSLLNEYGHYDSEDPFFTIKDGIYSLDTYDLKREFPEEVKKLVCWDVVQFLDDYECFEAFETFVKSNYQGAYRDMDFDKLENYDVEGLFDADWNELAKSLVNKEKQVTRLSEADLRAMINKTLSILSENHDLDAEMALWDERGKSKFGAVLKKIEKKVIEMFGEEENEYGINTSLIGDIITAYALDGNKLYTAKKIYHMLKMYDMLDNGDEHLDSLVKEMLELAKDV